MQWKLILLLALLALGGGGCLAGGSLQMASLPSAPLWDEGRGIALYEGCRAYHRVGHGQRPALSYGDFEEGEWLCKLCCQPVRNYKPLKI